jgi:spoIIIJ-associated protein
MGRLVYLLEGDCRHLRRTPKLLSAIQTFVELAAGREEERRVNCFLDLDGRHTARRELLQTLALDTADLVEHTGRRVVIEGLTSFERREVHEHLKESDAVETESEGEDPTRYLLVSNRS